ncbi:MAG: TRAP transporter substrate-binding protein [Moraxellaceae bacterium]|nr:TRAP transporter substrate-binding protein [Moraxellaceae bacterium]
MKRQITALALTLGAVFGAGCATAGKPAPVTVRVVTPFATGHILADTALQFKQELEKRAPHITVTVQTAVLNEQTINPAMQSCNPAERVGDIMLTGGQPIQDYAPEYFFFNGPYVIRDFHHLQEVWEGKLGDKLVKILESNGKYVAFDPVYRGFRQFTSNKPINTPADFSGLKLRLPPTPDWIAVWSSLGVTPVQVPLTGIYAALQNGTAEASEGDLTQIQSLKLYEVQTHLTLTNHLVGFGMQMANACFFRNELSKSDQSKVRAALKKAAQWGTRTIQQRESTILSQLQAAGMTVVTPDAAAIRTAAEPAINNLFATKWTVTTWKKVLDE